MADDKGQPEPADGHLVQLLQGRDGSQTTVVLRDGRRLLVFDIAWGYDMGDDHAHVTTNIIPGIEGATVDFFVTSDVATVLDETDGLIYSAS